jgi:hypothetical protein
MNKNKQMILNSNIIRRIGLIFAGILFITIASKAQEGHKSNPWALKLQYVGEFVLHPGLSIGTDYTITSNGWFNLHWDTEMGGYVHKRNNNSVFVQSTVGTRYTTGFALFADVQVGLGYMLSMPDGDVYSVDDTGTMNLKGRPVTSHLKPTFSLLFGWDGKRNRDIPLSVYTGLEAYMQSGFNHVMLPHAAFRFGVSYQL